MLKSTMPDEKSRLVYSTDKIIPRNEKSANRPHHAASHASQQKVSVRLERKRRGGKSVTLIEGLQISAMDRESLLKQLKTRLGTGGALKNSFVEIKGDHRDAIMALLSGMGYRAKRSGG
jgi:translation initiation factor 1